MEMGILDALLEYGSMGIFAAFLVWQHLSMQKRFDAMVEKFQGQLEGIQEKNQINEDKLRDRYDAVIKHYQSNESSLRAEVAEQLTKAHRKIEDLEKSLPFDTLQIQIEGLSLNQRNTHSLVEKGFDALKEMQEKERVREMIRAKTSGGS